MHIPSPSDVLISCIVSPFLFSLIILSMETEYLSFFKHPVTPSIIIISPYTASSIPFIMDAFVCRQYLQEYGRWHTFSCLEIIQILLHAGAIILLFLLHLEDWSVYKP